MIWKFPSRLPSVDLEEINPETWQEVAQDQIKSTYQSDFTGIPQGKAIEKKIDKHCIVLLTFKVAGFNIQFYLPGGRLSYAKGQGCFPGGGGPRI